MTETPPDGGTLEDRLFRTLRKWHATLPPARRKLVSESTLKAIAANAAGDAGANPDMVRQRLGEVGASLAETILYLLRTHLEDPVDPFADLAEDTEDAVAEPAPPRSAYQALDEDHPHIDPGATGLEFARWDLQSIRDQVRDIDALDLEGRGVLLTWGPPDDPAPALVYRLVTRDEYPPETVDIEPGWGHALAVLTRPASLLDPRPFRHAVRYYEVWVHEGETLEAAAAAVPTRFAATAVAAPVEGLRASPVIDDELDFTWRLAPGVTAVEAFCYPGMIGKAPVGGVRAYPQPLDTATATHCHVKASRQLLGHGTRHVFHVVAGTDSLAPDGSPSPIMSAPREIAFEIDWSPKPVNDLAVTDKRLRPRGNLEVDLEWTPPSQMDRVEIYRSRNKPSRETLHLVTGADQADLDQVLHRMGLEQANLVAQPHRAGEDGSIRVRGVVTAWPITWFTPVSRYGTKAQVGLSQAVDNLPPVVTDPEDPRHAVLVERVDRQILSFVWPAEDVDFVDIYLDEDFSRSAPIAMDRDTFDLEGGHTFSGADESARLDPRGCDIWLVSRKNNSDASGRPCAPWTSPASVVRYAGLTRLEYKLEPVGRQGRRVLSVRLSPGEVGLNKIVRFRLVHRPDRFPLGPQDGEVLAASRFPERLGSAPRAAEPVGAPDPNLEVPGLREGVCYEWSADLGDRSGYFRAFVSESSETPRGQLALLDPPIDTLWIKR
jgi:hypothetical protein